VRAALALAAACALALSCGRSELDWVGTDGVPAATGSAGTTGSGGTTGAAGTRAAAGSGGAAGTRAAGGTSGGAGTLGFAGTTGTGAAGSGPLTQIPCGGATSTCTAGVQKCCIDLMAGTSSCVPSAQPCPAGPSISCLDTASCGPERACCLSIGQPPSTSCGQPLSCLAGGGLIICTTDRDCPLAGRCCPTGAVSFCSLGTCP
jgi:hypothetical protein